MYYIFCTLSHKSEILLSITLQFVRAKNKKFGCLILLHLLLLFVGIILQYFLFLFLLQCLYHYDKYPTHEVGVQTGTKE